jgi:hypothetical protein
MLVNGVDLSTYKLWVETPRGLGDAPARSDDVLPTRGAGGLLSPEAAKVESRVWRVEAVLIADSASEALSLWDQVKLLLADSWLEVVFEPWTDRMTVCRYQGMEWLPQPSILMPGFRLALTFLAPNPYLVSPTVDSYGLEAGDELSVVLGTAPSPFLARFIGPATKPSLLYRDANGVQRGVITLGGEIVAGRWLEFNSQTLRLEQHSETGVVSNAAGWLETTSQLFSLDPMDGTPEYGPTLSLDVGKALIYVRRAWR